MNRYLAFVLSLCIPGLAWGQGGAAKFKQLDELLPTPSEVRLASGAPGPAYWQQRASYRIDVELDDEKRTLTGDEVITYENRSPHALPYLWLQLDQNSFRRTSGRQLVGDPPNFDKFSYRTMSSLLARESFEGGVTLTKVADGRGRALKYTVIDTMMRIDLAEPLRSGKRTQIQIAWHHNINNAKEIWGRGGYEHFDDDGHRIYTIAQWFPRMAVYDDVDGWQHKQFLGRGEFTLELGDYDVRITAPADHVVAATGSLQNPRAVLTSAQRKRLGAAKKATSPQFIVTPDEAKAAMKEASAKKKTWRFTARNVRDFAFASSRRFIWDAMGCDTGLARALCMSFYPIEAEPLWKRYSTPAVAHTLDVYGRMTFPYPYPVAISVNGPIGGMEYPMISFNGPRAEKDGTYYARAGKKKNWFRSKYGLISVVIHEVGHNWFPMIVNSDERQWTWMDEGLNSFVQFIAEQEWEVDYPSWRGHPKNIIPYMKSGRQVPIMTNSESLLQFGNNAYGKPATALNILRETVMGRQNFDYAFKTYTNLWRFKRPMPADFFRIMEDASGVDLDWFWRAWFYGTKHVDIGIKRVRQFTFETGDPAVDKPARKREKEAREPEPLTQMRNEAEEKPYLVNRFPELKDFYNSYDADVVTEQDREKFEEMVKKLEPWEKALLKTERFFYVVDLENVGGVVMPVPMAIEYADGKTEIKRYPAELWRLNSKSVSKLLMTKQPIKRIELDPAWEIADADRANNVWPSEVVPSRFKLFKRTYDKNQMQKEKAWKEKKAKEAKKKAEEEKKKAEEDKKKAEEAEKKGEKAEKKGEKAKEGAAEEKGAAAGSPKPAAESEKVEQAAPK